MGDMALLAQGIEVFHTFCAVIGEDGAGRCGQQVGERTRGEGAVAAGAGGCGPGEGDA